MIFSSPIFLFGFLPIALLLYYLTPNNFKNISLLVASLLFYAWGEVFYLATMLASIITNFFIGKLIYSTQEKNHSASKAYLTLGIIINIGLLISFKYANFIVDNINSLLLIVKIYPIHLSPVHLPLGISFFTFQAISYIVDVYRKEVKAQNNIFNLALYISLFPQLIAGPIVRYHDIATQILNRTHSIDQFSSGIQRFIIGLAKKSLIANPLGELAENIFSLPAHDITMPLAWMGLLAYSLQIYFDFSGYSDMAIGLGRMFGFRFLENFNYPYISKSLREFWRRWHISLSTWFRDYVYIPLGGSRVSTWRVYLNLLIVFLLTGIWHGASWNFIVWGLFHGFFLAIEHAGFSKILNKLWLPFQHFYAISVILASWVFFRAENMAQAIGYFSALCNFSNWHTSAFQFAQVSSNESEAMLALGILFSLPIYVTLKHKINAVCHNLQNTITLIYIPRLVFLSSIFILSLLKVASSTYNPFIYFRF